MGFVVRSCGSIMRFTHSHSSGFNGLLVCVVQWVSGSQTVIENKPRLNCIQTIPPSPFTCFLCLTSSVYKRCIGCCNGDIVASALS